MFPQGQSPTNRLSPKESQLPFESVYKPHLTLEIPTSHSYQPPSGPLRPQSPQLYPQPKASHALRSRTQPSSMHWRRGRHLQYYAAPAILPEITRLETFSRSWDPLIVAFPRKRPPPTPKANAWPPYPLTSIPVTAISDTSGERTPRQESALESCKNQYVSKKTPADDIVPNDLTELEDDGGVPLPSAGWRFVDHITDLFVSKEIYYEDEYLEHSGYDGDDEEEESTP